MRKYLGLFAFVLLIALVAAGCSSKSETSGTSGNAGGNTGGNTGSSQSAAGDGSEGLSGKITIASWAAAADSLEETAGNFKNIHPNAQIDIQRVGHDYQSIIPPLTAGKGAPDIVHIEQRDFQTFLRQFEGQFVDLQSEIGDKKDEFAEIAWAAVEKDGKAYGVPWDLGPAGVWYRTDYYEQAGIDVESIKTWDDFIAAGKQLQAAVEGVNMVAFDTVGSDPNPSTWMLLMNQLGGRYMDENGKIDFANEPNIRAMEMVKRFKDEGIVLHAGNWDELVQAVSGGKTASVILPVWFAGTISVQAEDQAGLWGVMPLPAFEEGGPNEANLGGGVLAITTQSENQELALEFIKYALMTNEGQDVQMKYGLFPSWQPYYDSEGFQKEDEFFGFKLADFFGSVAKNIPVLEFGPYYMDFHSNLLNAYGAVLTGQKSAEDALKEAEERSAAVTLLEITSR